MSESNTNNSQIVERIRKLLRLGGNNPNENEANSAILQAHRLMAKHGIETVQLEENQEQISYSTVYCQHKGNRKFRKILSSVIALNFRCRCFSQDGRVAFFGRSNDVAVARDVFEYAYTFAYRESDRLYRKRRQMGHDGTDVVNSYAIGFIGGLREKLEQQSTALMVVVPQDVQDRYAELSKNFKKANSTVKVSRLDRKAYEQGQTDGRTALNGRRLEAAGSGAKEAS